VERKSLAWRLNNSPAKAENIMKPRVPSSDEWVEKRGCTNNKSSEMHGGMERGTNPDRKELIRDTKTKPASSGPGGKGLVDGAGATAVEALGSKFASEPSRRIEKRDEFEGKKQGDGGSRFKGSATLEERNAELSRRVRGRMK